MTDDPKPLSPRHARFVAEYLRDLNATQAYIRAGYKPRCAEVSACKLLRHPQVAVAIAEGQKQVALSLRISVEQIAAEYSKIALANMDDFMVKNADGSERVDLAKADRAKRAGLIELTITGDDKIRPRRVKIKLGKLQALAMLMKYIDVLVPKPAPGLTPEERKSLEEDAASYRRSRDHAYEQTKKLEEELRTMRQALVAAEQTFAQVGVMPPSAVLAAAPTDQRAPSRAPAASEPPGDLRQTLQRALAAPQPSPPLLGIPPRDSPEFRDLLGKLRRGTLDYAMARRMIAAGYGPEPKPDAPWQMEVEYEPDWG